MAKFRYYIDFGSGYALTDIYDNKLSLKVSKKISLAIESKEINGSFSLAGTDAQTAYNKRTTTYYLPLKVEEYNGTSWNTLHECYIDIRGEYLLNSEILTISNFQEKGTDASIIQAAYDNTLKTIDLGISHNAINETYTATRLDVLGVATALDKVAYIATYDIEDNAVSYTDLRWAYFEWQRTIGVTPNLQHIYSTRKFDTRPQLNFGTNGYTEISYNSTYIWVKLPPYTYTGESWSDLFIRESYRLDYVLDAIVTGIDSGIEFDSTDCGTTNWVSTSTYLGDGNEWASKNVEGINFTLKSLFDFFKAFYNISWYITGGKLKFRNNAHTYYNSSLNWATYTANIDSFEMVGELPDTEIWEFLDESLDRYLLSYFDKGVLTAKKELSHRANMVHDFATLINSGESSGKLVWITLSGANPFTKTPKELFELYSKDRVFSEYAPFEVPIDPDDAYIALTSHDTQPIYSVTVEKWEDDYSAFDLFSRITIAGSNVGYLNNYSIDLNTGVAKFNIYFDTLTT